MPYVLCAIAALLAACARPNAPTLKPIQDTSLAALPAREDHVSAVAIASWVYNGFHGQPSCDHGPIAEVMPDASSASETHYPSPPPLADAFGPIIDAPLPDGRFAVLERMRGLRVVDPHTQPAHVSSAFALPEGHHPLELRVVGERALLVATRDFAPEYLVQWVELPRGEQPRLLSELRLPGTARGVFVRAGRGAALRFVVIADAYPGPCAKRSGSVARVIEVDPRTHALVSAFEQPLGSAVWKVRRSGDWLMVEDGSHAAHRVRFFDLDAKSADRALSPPLDVGVSVHDFYAPADAPRDAPIDVAFYTSVSKAEGVDRVDTHHVLRANMALQARKHCTQSLAAPPPPDPKLYYAEPPRIAQALFLGEHTLLVAPESGGTAYARVFDISLRDCAVREQRLRGRHFVATDDRTMLVGLTPHAASELDATLYTLPEAAPRGELRAQLGGGHAAFDVAHSRLVGPRELAIPYRHIDARGMLREGDQILKITEDKQLERGAQLAERLRAIDASGAHVLRGAHGLRFEPGPSGPSAAPTDLWTQHIEAELLEPATPGAQCALARVRWPGPAQRFDAHAGALEGLLEFVPADRDPQLGAASAAFAISGRARLHRVGSLLVAIAQDAPNGDRDRVQPCRIEVFDARDLGAVRKTASLVSEELCDADRLLADQPAFAARDALVFARVVPRYDRPVVHPHGGRIELRALDLRDPGKPAWLPLVKTPEPELALSVWHDGEHAYYAFRLDKIGGSKLLPEAHFYLSRIDLRDPSAPRFGERISIPGEPSRMEGRTLYVREGRWGRDASGQSEAKHRLRTLELSDAGVRSLAVTTSDQEAATIEHRVWRNGLSTLSRCRGRTLYLDYGALHFD